jgi:hypothetical protein
MLAVLWPPPIALSFLFGNRRVTLPGLFVDGNVLHASTPPPGSGAAFLAPFGSGADFDSVQLLRHWLPRRSHSCCGTNAFKTSPARLVLSTQTPRTEPRRETLCAVAFAIFFTWLLKNVFQKKIRCKDICFFGRFANLTAQLFPCPCRCPFSAQSCSRISTA